MIEISIVTGTYNRLKILNNMVDSVRKSIGGVPYEIIIVDGGSNDGTITWCKQQKDVVLIEHGELLGAVKAFNDGAMIAKGRYVILANDDIEFLDYSILSALSFMQDNLHIGIGCFYQDRYNKAWHVDRMPAVINGKQASVYYGQVCIVPKWLGDEVGWWGDYLRTYGGDNELSCNVWELGYPIMPAPCTYIHDTVPMDELRNINNIQALNRGKHPDTEAWRAKWTKGESLGPNIKRKPDDPIYLERTKRIFYAPIYEPGHQIQYNTKRGLREALKRKGLVVEWDYMNQSMVDLPEIACAFDPDLFVIQAQDVDKFTIRVMEHLRRQHPNAVFVNWNGDYHPETLLSREYILLTKTFDLNGLVTTSIGDKYNNAGVSWFYWQIGYEEELNPVSHMRAHDVVFLANGYSQSRLSLARGLQSMNLDVGFYGSWPKDIGASGSNLYDFDEGYALYRNCKIAIGDSQWPGATGFVSNRLFQAMAAGAFVLHQQFSGMEELLGLRDGVHLVIWSSVEDLRQKIEYWLQRDEERNRIAAVGQDTVLNMHSFDARVEELFNKLYA